MLQFLMYPIVFFLVAAVASYGVDEQTRGNPGTSGIGSSLLVLVLHLLDGVENGVQHRRVAHRLFLDRLAEPLDNELGSDIVQHIIEATTEVLGVVSLVVVHNLFVAALEGFAEQQVKQVGADGDILYRKAHPDEFAIQQPQVLNLVEFDVQV